MSPNALKKLHSSSSDLFGIDDSEFLEALAKVDMPGPATEMPAIAKELSSSSDLFGIEDPTFLDELSRTAFPDDMVHKTPTLAETRRASKRSHSPDEEFYYNVTPSMDSIPSDNVAKNGFVYTDSDIYGSSKFGGFGEYMSRKRAKLGIQNVDLEDSSGGKKSTLFQGLALYINGKTNPSVQELRKLIIQHGGIFHPYLDRKKMVTHIIASNLTPSKVLEFKHMKVTTPAWLLESIKAGTLLQWRDYMIGADRRPDESQGQPKPTAGPASNASINTREKRKLTQSEASEDSMKISCEQEEATPLTSDLSPSKIISNSQPAYTTDPSTTEQAAQMPSYAPSGSNPHAKRKMEDPQWRAANTAVAPGFIEGYYKNSRLHHLSTWKAELQDLVSKAAERAEKADTPGVRTDEFESDGNNVPGIKFQKPSSPRKGKGKIPGTQVIMHCDFDSFFVSAGLVDRPHLKGKPVVVCHSQGEQGGVASTSEVASSSYEARKFGIKNGMSLGQAKKLCPEIHTIPYEFERYKRLSLQFYTILMSYADDLQAVSVDEALVDVTSTVENARRTASIEDASRPPPDFAKELAETIRSRLRQATGCEVSIGISHNILLARVATRRAKPAGSYHIQVEEVASILAPLDVQDIRGFGWSTRSRLEAKFGVTTLGELEKRPKSALCDALGKKNGETLWKAIRGIDETKIESERVRKSVSSEINYGIRFNNNEDTEKFIRSMAGEVSRRLANISMCGRSLTLKVMTRDPTAPVEAPKFLGHGICDTTSKTAALAGPSGQATADENVIGECAWRLLKGMRFDPKELRGIGIHVQKLEGTTDTGNAQGMPTSGGQSVLPFKKMSVPVEEFQPSPERKRQPGPMVVVDPPSQEVIFEDIPSSLDDTPRLRPDTFEVALPSISQVDPTFLEALPADIRDEIEQEYARAGSGQAIAGPSRHKSPGEYTVAVYHTPSKVKKYDANPPADIARITQQLAPKSRPSMSPSKQIHPLFEKRKAPAALKVSPTELRLLEIDPEVWAGLPVELQREQLAAFRAANVGTGIAIRASMSTQAKQERILSRWRAMRRRSPSVGIRGRRPEIIAKLSELPGLKQRGKNKSEELKVNDTDDIQAVIGHWVRGFEDDGPRQGDVEYFGKFLERCVMTDIGAERAVSALKWWRVLLRQRWAEMEKLQGEDGLDAETDTQKVGREWWQAFRDVKARMDSVVGKRFGGNLSLR